MLGIEIICVGKLGPKFYREGCEEYLKRLSAYAAPRITELAETRLATTGVAAEQRVIADESRRIEVLLDKRSRAAVTVLCVEGKQMTSEQLAAHLDTVATEFGSAVFVIGGSLGLTENLKHRARMRLSLSAMTLPHQLARLVLLEQLYRARSISAGAKYHK